MQRLPTGWCSGRCPGLQPKMRKDLLDHWRFQDRRNDLQLAAAVRAVLQVDLEDALEQLDPAQPHRVADDPAFRGWPHELVAADYVSSLKRFYDPAIITEHLYTYENAKLLGLSELRRHVIASKTPFPYDAEVPGIRALDRYHLEVRLAEPNPRSRWCSRA